MKRVEFCGFKCEVQIAEYAEGHSAIRLIDVEDGMPVATATVNIPDLNSDEVAIKDYSENEGVYNALLEADVIYPAHRKVELEYVTVPICKLK